jgi:hypothetical protein
MEKEVERKVKKTPPTTIFAVWINDDSHNYYELYDSVDEILSSYRAGQSVDVYELTSKHIGKAVLTHQIIPPTTKVKKKIR